jgi:hypothetical protein
MRRLRSLCEKAMKLLPTPARTIHAFFIKLVICFGCLFHRHALG